MAKYANEKKEHALSQMSTPRNKPAAEVAQLTSTINTLCKRGLLFKLQRNRRQG